MTSKNWACLYCKKDVRDATFFTLPSPEHTDCRAARLATERLMPVVEAARAWRAVRGDGPKIMWDEHVAMNRLSEAVAALDAQSVAAEGDDK